MFGLSYRTLVGNDIDGQEHGYKIHLIYGATASPSEKNYSTVNESPEAMTLSWELSTTPVAVPGFKPTAHLEVDSTKADADKMQALEDILYGTESQEARLPMPEEVMTLMGGQATLSVTVLPESAETVLLGKAVADLQSDVAVGDGIITGSLKNVTGYTGFSSVASEQKGHYLALKIDATVADAKTTVELIGGTKGAVELDADRNIVLLVRNKNTQIVRVITTAGGVSIVKMYSLSGLTLENE